MFNTDGTTLLLGGLSELPVRGLTGVPSQRDNRTLGYPVCVCVCVCVCVVNDIIDLKFKNTNSSRVVPLLSCSHQTLGSYLFIYIYLFIYLTIIPIIPLLSPIPSPFCPNVTLHVCPCYFESHNICDTIYFLLVIFLFISPLSLHKSYVILESQS